MAEITLHAERGRTVGSAAARRLRHEGRIPAVVYGHGSEPLPISVDGRDLRTALSTEAGLNALLSLQVGDESHLAMARDIQRHPVRHTVTHVDFQLVNRNEAMAAEVPLTLVGEAEEVEHADGVVEQQLFSVPVQAVPGDIPPHLELDVSALVVGGSLRLADISLPPGVEVVGDPETVAVTAVAPSVTEEEPGVGAGEEPGHERPAAGKAGDASAAEAAGGASSTEE